LAVAPAAVVEHAEPGRLVHVLRKIAPQAHRAQALMQHDDDRRIDGAQAHPPVFEAVSACFDEIHARAQPEAEAEAAAAVTRATWRFTASSVASFWSRCGEWRQFGIKTISARPWLFSRIESSCFAVPYSSSAPWIAVTGQRMRVTSASMLKPRMNAGSSQVQ